MKITGAYVKDGTIILIVSGGTMITTTLQRDLHYEIFTDPFSITGDFIHGDPRKYPYSTKSRVKFRQSKEMEANGEIAVDTTGEGYLLEFLKDSMTGLLGTDGSILEYHGRVNFGRGLIIESSEADPLTFKIDKSRGYVYVKGTGRLQLPDGRTFGFPDAAAENITKKTKNGAVKN